MEGVQVWRELSRRGDFRFGVRLSRRGDFKFGVGLSGLGDFRFGVGLSRWRVLGSLLLLVSPSSLAQQAPRGLPRTPGASGSVVL